MRLRKSAMAVLLLSLAFSVLPAIAATPSTNQQSRNNLEFQEHIRKELVTLPYYGVYDNLSFEVKGSTVILSGEVVRPVTKTDAERRVKETKGVTNVINNIQVLPLSSMDDGIRLRTYRAILRMDGLSRYEQGANPSIHIVVNRGHVTLEGVVSTVSDSRMAFIAANGVPGVFSVTNNLRVENGRRS